VKKLAESGSAANVEAASLDQLSPSFETDLLSLRPDIVLHTAGPYQDQDYRVARACIDCGSHYVDLADGRKFVDGITELEQAALGRRVLVVSGASTLPGLSSAVIDHFKEEFARLKSIEISIAPAHQTPRGSGTIAAVLSYCGRPFQVLEKGNWVTRYGWQNFKWKKYPLLGRRLSAACDVPDLSLLPGYVPESETVTFHAALEAWWEQAGLWLMAWMTRVGLVRNWAGLTGSFQSLSDRLVKFGSDTGGMHMRLTGIDQNKKMKKIDWYLTARKNHGPEIPVSPALVLVRKLARKDIELRGAFPCLGLVNLPEFMEEVSNLDISWEVTE